MTKIIQPKTIMSDHEPALLGNEFSEYLHEKQIPLKVNALGDHHELGFTDISQGEAK